VLWTQASLDAEAHVLLDPNTFSDDGTVSLKAISFSEDGLLLAYSTSSGGSDWSTIKVRPPGRTKPPPGLLPAARCCLLGACMARGVLAPPPPPPPSAGGKSPGPGLAKGCWRALSHSPRYLRDPQLLRISPEGKPEALGDELEFTKFTGMTWTHDNKGFFYKRWAVVGGGEFPPRLAAGLGAGQGSPSGAHGWCTSCRVVGWVLLQQVHGVRSVRWRWSETWRGAPQVPRPQELRGQG
jgi:hypothetical protein